MPVSDFISILTRITGHTKYVYLHVLGEPTLHPNLVDILAGAADLGFAVNLTTNGSLLAEKGEVLLSSPALRQINISLHSFSHASTREKERYLSQILFFIRKSQSSRIWLNLRLWQVKSGSKSSDIAIDSAMLDWLQQQFDLPMDFALGLDCGRSITLAPRIFLSCEPQFTWPHIADPRQVKQGSCRGLRDHLAILVDGSIVPCCLDADGHITLGNIHRQSLAEIVSSRRAQDISNGFRRQQRVEALCQGCNFGKGSR